MQPRIAATSLAVLMISFSTCDSLAYPQYFFIYYEKHTKSAPGFKLN